ncbi:hypothetical protein BJF79_02230 [Actinomadura sp. CNU-125]|nr:hypothetical protein BJF79_02230 [Actinomadura sp. CNU-125]
MWAMTATGAPPRRAALPFVPDASRASASRRAAKSWPSASRTVQPKLRQRSASGSRPIASSVGPVICRRFRSMTAVRLPSPSAAEAMAASHTEPSCSSPSPRTAKQRRPRSASANPLASASPCPSDPVGISTPGTARTGWPISLLPGRAYSASSATGKKPRSASTPYRHMAPCPLPRTRTSRSAAAGRRGSIRMTSK